jgi:hypothetical protein
MNKTRLKLFNFIVYDLFKHNKCEIPPWYCKIIHWILFPIESFKYSVNDSIYNFCTDIYTIHNQRITGKLIREIIIKYLDDKIINE